MRENIPSPDCIEYPAGCITRIYTVGDRVLSVIDGGGEDAAIRRNTLFGFRQLLAGMREFVAPPETNGLRPYIDPSVSTEPSDPEPPDSAA